MDFSPAAFGSLVALGVCIAGGLALLTLLLGRRAHEDALLTRRVLSHLDEADSSRLAQQNPLVRNFVRAGQKLESWLDPNAETARLLTQAGWRGPERRVLFYALRGVALLLAGIIFLALSVAGKVSPQQLPVTVFVLLAFAILLPTWTLRWAATRRRQQLAAEVPLFIHVLVLLFEAGLSTQQALASLNREGRGVLPNIGKEMDSVLRQLESGGEIGPVLQTLTELMQVDDLSTVLGVLRQMERYGGEVRGPLLETLAVIEERAALELRETVNKVSGRMTVVMVLFFFPALLIFVAGPAVVALLKAFGNVAPG